MKHQVAIGRQMLSDCFVAVAHKSNIGSAHILLFAVDYQQKQSATMMFQNIGSSPLLVFFRLCAARVVHTSTDRRERKLVPLAPDYRMG
jgi:hypothetical protein